LGWRSSLDVLTSVVLIATALFLVKTSRNNRAALAIRGTAQPVTNESILPTPGASVGSEAAPWTLVVFSDFECSYCGRFARELFPKLKAAYIHSGRIRFVFRHLPLIEKHPQAMGAAEIAECAGPAGFWVAHDRFFSIAPPHQLDAKVLASVAKETGLTEKDLASCRAEGSSGRQRIAEDVDAAKILGVRGTPAFFLGPSLGDGRMKVVSSWQGVRSWESLQASVESVVAGKQ
jgi:protein-disulfide isomerase